MPYDGVETNRSNYHSIRSVDLQPNLKVHKTTTKCRRISSYHNEFITNVQISVCVCVCLLHSQNYFCVIAL